MIQSCRASSGQAGSYWTLRRWPGTWSRRAACSRSWPHTGPRCSPTPITRTCSPRRGGAGRRCRVPGGTGQIGELCRGQDSPRPGRPKIDWDDPAAREALVWALVNDANALVEAFAAARLEEAAASALALLALVAGQDVEPAEGSDGTGGRGRSARKGAEDRTLSTADPDTPRTPAPPHTPPPPPPPPPPPDPHTRTIPP